MKINETKAATDVGRVATPETPVAAPKDRVTVSKSREVESAVSAAKTSQTADRPQRLKALEARVRAGEYHPDPSRVAEEILQDAEIEARLQSLLRH
jgi:anti-sigma28 factor (negative regulator of flagellin synthesis)